MEKEDVLMPFQGIDIISSLPQDILNHILFRLPIRDAVRTSILSSKWRFAWSKIPIINFNLECRLLLKEQTTSSRLVHIVDKVLLLHDGPTIRAFKVSEFINGYNSDVDRWILFLSRKGIECLELKFHKGVNDNQVTSCLFSCKQLQVLRLHHCTLDIPSKFQGFKFLLSLDLKCVNLAEDTINNLLPLCPLLETLELQYDNHLRCCRINAPQLKYLSIRGAFEDLIFMDCSELEYVDIFLPKLVYNFQKNKLANTCNLEKILGCLLSLVHLRSEGHFLKFLALGVLTDRLPNVFENLKVLFLSVNFQDKKQISTAFCILGSSPNLQNIDIEATWLPKVEYDKDTDENVSDCELHQLKHINMNSLNGEAPEMEFLKSVLANAPVLETVSITIAKDAKWREGNILKSLISFHRASFLLKKFTVD